MTDYKRVSDLDAITSIASTDLLELICDNGDTTYTSKKITYGNLRPQSYVRANINSTTTQTITKSTWVTVIFDEEVTDTLAEYNPATGIFTANKTGYYLVSSGIYWANSDVFAMYLGINKNNAAAPQIYERSTLAGTGQTRSFFISMTISLTASDTIRIQAREDSGSNFNLGSGSDTYNFLTIVRII